MILTEGDLEDIQRIVDHIINTVMEKDGAITEIEELIKQSEVNGYEYKISVKVERVMEDEE